MLVVTCRWIGQLLASLLQWSIRRSCAWSETLSDHVAVRLALLILTWHLCIVVDVLASSLFLVWRCQIVFLRPYYPLSIISALQSIALD